MYGEWLYAKHTVYYDELTHYFMEFDLFDKEKHAFLSTNKRRELLKGSPFIVSVLVLFEGRLDSLNELTSYLGKSHFKSERFPDVLEKQCLEQGLSYETVKRQTDSTDRMEGIYIKVEEGDFIVDRLKYVRSSFLNTILDSETHWIDRPMVPNRLKPGTDLFAREG